MSNKQACVLELVDVGYSSKGQGWLSSIFLYTI